MEKTTYKIIFLNQMAGPLFRELAEDLSEIWGPCLLYTGHPDTLAHSRLICLKVAAGPAYNRNSIRGRLISWIKYFGLAFLTVWRQPATAFLFIVSNPPFLGIIGAFFKLLRAQSYAMLVYDVYPDILINMGVLKSRLVPALWRALNRFVYSRSQCVLTIGHDMAATIQSTQMTFRGGNRRTSFIPPWVDTASIKPIPKLLNTFCREHGLLDKTTVLYSGNMGYTHDVETLLGAAEKLSNENEILFLFIGDGAKKPHIEKTVTEKRLENVLVLPFQPESVLPLSMAAGDIGIVAYGKGTEGCMVPSKTFYYMAAGVVPFVLSEQETDLTTMVRNRKCGVWVRQGEVETLVENILRFHRNHEMLDEFKRAARDVALTDFSRKNTNEFAAALAPFFLRTASGCDIRGSATR